jgi:Ni,Fe-hydrogenase III large subunit
VIKISSTRVLGMITQNSWGKSMTEICSTLARRMVMDKEWISERFMSGSRRNYGINLTRGVRMDLKIMCKSDSLIVISNINRHLIGAVSPIVARFVIIFVVDVAGMPPCSPSRG